MRYSAWGVLVRPLCPVLFAAGHFCAMGQHEANPLAKVRAGLQAGGGMLELRSGTNVAAFLPAKAYLVLHGHALTVEFHGTPGVMPRMQGEPGAAFSESYFSQRVLYKDLWPGISLTFGLSPNGNCEATYVLVAGADVGKIRLRYNVPVGLQKDGTLKFRFSAGAATESAPEAWQDIEGKRASVAVSFTLAGGDVGFTLGAYDPRFPLTIDPHCEFAVLGRCCPASVHPQLLFGSNPIGNGTQEGAS